MNSKSNKKQKLKKLSDKFPCSCGHMKYLHLQEYYTDQYEWCCGLTPAARNKYGRTYNCDCERFVPDNLIYLEQCAQTNGKGELK